MQLFFISPAIVYFIYRFKRNALYVLSLLVFGCVGYTLAIHVQYNLSNLYVFIAMDAFKIDFYLNFNPFVANIQFFMNNVQKINFLFHKKWNEIETYFN